MVESWVWNLQPWYFLLILPKPARQILGCYLNYTTIAFFHILFEVIISFDVIYSYFKTCFGILKKQRQINQRKILLVNIHKRLTCFKSSVQIMRLKSWRKERLKFEHRRKDLKSIRSEIGKVKFVRNMVQWQDFF